MSIKTAAWTFLFLRFKTFKGYGYGQKKSNPDYHFYEKCLANRLTENDFSFAGNGSTI